MRINPNQVKLKFSKVLERIDEDATELFFSYERRAIQNLAQEWLRMQKREIRQRLEKIISEKGLEKFIQEASKLFVDFGILVQAMEKDLGNMRKARGGKTFEKIVYKMLTLIGIPVEEPKEKMAREKLKRIDLVIPSINTALNTPDHAVFLTCKRTLRERWKQEVPQVGINQRVYLLTIDDDLSESKAKEIHEKGLIAFVKDEVKERAEIRNMPWIRRFKEFPEELRGYETR